FFGLQHRPGAYVTPRQCVVSSSSSGCENVNHAIGLTVCENRLGVLFIAKHMVRRVLLPLLLLLWFVVCFVAIATNQTVTSSNPTPSEVCECEQKRVQRWRSLERRV
uniref:Uncharacterized protein n=1 Tax=Anopheles arabiensis TaxID=7173 RepID=A0A182HP77_ANOAR